MKYSGIVASSLIFSLAAAAPLNNKRDMVVQTTYVEVTETIPCTKTVYVDTHGNPIAGPGATTTSVPGQFYQSSVTVTPSAAPASPSPSQSTSSSSSSAAAVPVVPSPSPSPTSIQTPSAAPVRTSSSTPVPVVSSSVYKAPVVNTPSPSPTPISIPAPVYTPTTTPTPTPSAASPVATAASGSSGYSSTCAGGAPCTGDMTFYTTGLGACGWTNDGSSEHVVALPHGLMGAQSNGNPYCGKMITISYGGKTTTAKVVDKCMGCEGDSIDLSTSAFNSLCDPALGRVTAQWWFN